MARRGRARLAKMEFAIILESGIYKRESSAFNGKTRRVIFVIARVNVAAILDFARIFWRYSDLAGCF